MSEMKSWNCPHCGGTIIPDENGKPMTKCPFCDSLLELDTRSRLDLVHAQFLQWHHFLDYVQKVLPSICQEEIFKLR